MRWLGEGIMIEAWIERKRDGQPFREHREQVSRTARGVYDSVETQLECEEGDEFEIRLRATSTGLNAYKPLPGMYLRATVDGRELHPSAMQQSYPQTSFKEMFTMENKEVYANSLQFATLPKTDDENAVQVRGQEVNRLGQIIVKVQRGSLVVVDTPVTYLTAEAEVGLVHEKQLKLGSTIKGTNRRPHPKSSASSQHFVPDHINEMCQFTWKYYTRDKLCIMGIVEDDRAIVDGPARGTRQNKRRVTEFEAQPEERAEGSSVRVKREKVEGESKHKEKRRRITGEGSSHERPIDLTE